MAPKKGFVFFLTSTSDGGFSFRRTSLDVSCFVPFACLAASLLVVLQCECRPVNSLFFFTVSDGSCVEPSTYVEFSLNVRTIAELLCAPNAPRNRHG